MPVPVIAAGVMAAGSIGGAILGSSAQKKAASQANASQQQATQAELQLGRESMALNRDIYGSNFNLLSPTVSRGNVAGESINALLGLPQAPALNNPLGGQATGGGGQMGGGVQTNPVYSQQPYGGVDDLAANLRSPLNAQRNAPMNSLLARHSQLMNDQGNTAPAPATAAPAQAAAPFNPNDALNNFANSAGMQFQLEQGSNALNNMYAARGQIQSGAAEKALQNYGQQTALQNYFMPYMGLLGNQQATGAQAGSAIAGVGSNFGNTAAAINSGMGANIQSGANAASNAALLRGQANANMYSGIGSALGGLASSFFPMGSPQTPQTLYHQGTH